MNAVFLTKEANELFSFNPREITLRLHTYIDKSFAIFKFADIDTLFDKFIRLDNELIPTWEHFFLRRYEDGRTGTYLLDDLEGLEKLNTLLKKYLMQFEPNKNRKLSHSLMLRVSEKLEDICKRLRAKKQG